MAKKGGKKGKGKKDKKKEKPIIPPVTTLAMLEGRLGMLCPRMGDAYTKTMQVEHILEDCAISLIKKSAKKQLTSLSLNCMKLSQLPDLTLIMPELQCLLEINLSKNNLFNGEHVFDAISRLERLTKMDLSENFLNGELSELAARMTNLEEVRLDVNHLTALGPAVGKWTKLKVFTCSDNSLTSIPVEACAWQALTHLNMKNNKIVAVTSDHLNAWPVLEKLYLGSNLLTEIPDEVGNLTQAVEMDFSNNAIEVIPNSLSLCTALQLLHLGNNKIQEVPPEIFSQLKSLRELQLYKNKISIIPPEIGNLACIERLSIASNLITSMPEELGACTTLVELYLSNNAKLSYIPSSAGHLRSLQELKLYKCPALKQLPTTALEMTALKELDLRAVKKQVCKISPECMEAFARQKCMVRGGVVKKLKGDPLPPAGAAGGGGVGGGGGGGGEGV